MLDQREYDAIEEAYEREWYEVVRGRPYIRWEKRDGCDWLYFGDELIGVSDSKTGRSKQSEKGNVAKENKENEV